MKRNSPSRFLKLIIAVLLTLNVTLIIENWRLSFWQPTSEVDAAKSARSLKSLPVFATANSAQVRSDVRPNPRIYSEILARPLFDASRRPPQPIKTTAAQQPSATPPPAPFPSDKFKLVGIMLNSDQSRRALVRTDSKKSAVWVVKGGTAGGWSIEDIGVDYVDFKLANSTGTLKMLVQSASAASDTGPKTLAPEKPAVSGSRSPVALPPTNFVSPRLGGTPHRN